MQKVKLIKIMNRTYYLNIETETKQKLSEEQIYMIVQKIAGISLIIVSVIGCIATKDLNVLFALPFGLAVSLIKEPVIS